MLVIHRTCVTISDSLPALRQVIYGDIRAAASSLVKLALSQEGDISGRYHAALLSLVFLIIFSSYLQCLSLGPSSLPSLLAPASFKSWYSYQPVSHCPSCIIYDFLVNISYWACTFLDCLLLLVWMQSDFGRHGSPLWARQPIRCTSTQRHHGRSFHYILNNRKQCEDRRPKWKQLAAHTFCSGRCECAPSSTLSYVIVPRPRLLQSFRSFFPLFEISPLSPFFIPNFQTRESSCTTETSSIADASLEVKRSLISRLIHHCLARFFWPLCPRSFATRRERLKTCSSTARSLA